MLQRFAFAEIQGGVQRFILEIKEWNLLVKEYQRVRMFVILTYLKECSL